MDRQTLIEEVFSNLTKNLSSDSVVSMPEADQCVIFKLNYAHQNILMHNRNPDVLLSIQAVLDALWEDLNTGHWSQVSEKTRTLYSLGSLFKVIRIIQEITFDIGCTRHKIEEAIKAADMGLLMGCGYQEVLSEAARSLGTILSQDYVYEKPLSEMSVVESGAVGGWDFPGIVGGMVSSVKCPSLEFFYKNFFASNLPVKLQDCINHWPALEKWKDISYLVAVAGPRLVPVELGSSYTKEDWGMKLIPFREFVERFIFQKSDKIGYLAQHQLFDQIPELKRDVHIPDYCCITDSDVDSSGVSGGAEEEVDINAWFGPAGTVSPLHFDPKHNLLCQVVGRKRIILYSPDDSGKLYPHEESMLHNTALVDPYAPDYCAYPEYESAHAYECHLNPGEILYIPPRWWHHVRSLDTSFSVSFWWK